MRFWRWYVEFIGFTGFKAIFIVDKLNFGIVQLQHSPGRFLVFAILRALSQSIGASEFLQVFGIFINHVLELLVYAQEAIGPSVEALSGGTFVLGGSVVSVHHLNVSFAFFVRPFGM